MREYDADDKMMVFLPIHHHCEVSLDACGGERK